MECAYYRVGTSHSSRHTPLCRQPEVDLALSKSQERHMECAYYLRGQAKVKGTLRCAVSNRAMRD